MAAEHCERMKDSGVPWIGKIPESWDVRKLKFCVAHRAEQRREAAIGYVGLENVESWTGKRISEKGDPEKDATSPEGVSLKFCRGDVLFGKLRPYLAKCLLADDDGCCSPEFIVMRALEHSGYLKYFLLSQPTIERINNETYGAKMPRANWDIVGNMLAPVPSYDEQNEISAYLDKKCAKIDEIISCERENIEDFRKLRSSIIFEAVTRGLDPSVPMKESGVGYIGKIPENWTTCSLKYLSRKIGSGKTPAGGGEVYSSDGIIFLRSQNIYGTGLKIDDVVHISPEIDEIMSGTRVEYDDVLLNITGGSIGRCCIFDLKETRANVNQHVCIIRTRHSSLRPHFLKYFFNSSCGPRVVELFQTGGNRAGLNFAQIGSIKIPLCDTGTQDAIIARLDAKCASIDALIAEKEALIADLEAYRRSLIFEVVTGKRRAA